MSTELIKYIIENSKRYKKEPPVFCYNRQDLSPINSTDNNNDNNTKNYPGIIIKKSKQLVVRVVGPDQEYVFIDEQNETEFLNKLIYFSHNKKINKIIVFGFDYRIMEKVIDSELSYENDFRLGLSAKPAKPKVSGLGRYTKKIDIYCLYSNDNEVMLDDRDIRAMKDIVSNNSVNNTIVVIFSQQDVYQELVYKLKS